MWFLHQIPNIVSIVYNILCEPSLKPVSLVCIASNCCWRVNIKIAYYAASYECTQMCMILIKRANKNHMIKLNDDRWLQNAPANHINSLPLFLSFRFFLSTSSSTNLKPLKPCKRNAESLSSCKCLIHHLFGWCVCVCLN